MFALLCINIRQLFSPAPSGFTEYNFGNSAVIKYYWATLGCLLVLAHQTENKASANSFSLFQHTKTEI